MVHQHLERLRRILRSSRVKCAEAEAKLAEAVADGNAKLTESEQRFHASDAKRRDAEAKLVQREAMLQHSIEESDMDKRARQACVEEIILLRHRSGEIQESLHLLEEEKQTRIQNEHKARHSLLRSFRWKEKEVDPVVLNGAVAFWGATVDKERRGRGKRTSKEMRKTILKAMFKHGFDGELEAEFEKDVIRKKRWNVFELARLSDLESKFNSEAIGSIAHAETGLAKNQQGLLPSATTFNNCLMDLNRKAARKGFSCMPDTNTWCWGDEEGNTLHEGVHRYVKALYFDAWDSRATADDPYIIAVTGDLARVSFSGKAVTMCGAKQCDRRLVSQQLTGNKGHMNQSRTLYTPAIGGYSTESDMMPLFEQLVDAFVEIEKQQFCVVDGKEYEVFIKVLVVADMMFLQKFTGHGGGCASTTHFCMFCSCISKFRHEGQPGGCEDCRSKRIVYDKRGLQVCLHHDVITPERLIQQRARLVHLQDKLRGTYPARKKPSWDNLAGLRLACLERCVEGVTNKDGRDAYNPLDKLKILEMNTKACVAWLNERTEGTGTLSFLSFCTHVCIYVSPPSYCSFLHVHSRWLYTVQPSHRRGAQYLQGTRSN